MSVRVTRTAQASWQGEATEGGGRIGLGSGIYEGRLTPRSRVADVERSNESSLEARLAGD
jgi:hypothetical protein